MNINTNKKYNLKHFWNYFKANFNIMVKETLEYKTNLYSNILTMIILTTLSFFIFYLLQSSIADVIGWKYYDYLLLTSILLSITGIVGVFLWNKGLNEMLLTGEFNFFINKPGSTFWNYFFAHLGSWGIISFIIRGIMTIGIIYIFNVEIYNLTLSIFIMLLFIYYFLSIQKFLESFAFFAKKSDSIFEHVWELEWNFFYYPAPFLKKYFDKLFLFIYPAFIGGSLIIPTIRNYEVWNLELQILILISLSIIFSIGTYFNWKIGLKRYEAFG